jgi:hypothetical protein
LSSAELTSLRSVSWSDREWQALLAVTVKGAEGVPVVGRYVATGGALEFHPRFPFDPGRAYAIAFNPGRLPQPRDSPTVSVAVSLPGETPQASTRIDAIYPSAHVWPANVLRVYLHFSGPMSHMSSVGRVRLLDEDGIEVTDALLPVDADLWNDDLTRHTVFFDPGRAKRGILPNRELGRALIPGRRYAIVVSTDWLDAHGQPLAEAFRHEFEVGPPVERALDMGDWQVASPRAGTTDPLVVRFPASLDHALLQRALGVAETGKDPLIGTIGVTAEEREWRFTPSQPWRAGGHDLIALSVLEDPSGNRVARAFEVIASSTDSEVERHTRAFDIR